MGFLAAGQKPDYFFAQVGRPGVAILASEPAPL